MKTTIWIIISSANRNLVYSTLVAAVKSKIVKYFGTKNCEPDDVELPIIAVTCEVTQDDINTIKKVLDSDSVNLVALIGSSESNRVNGDIINLRNN